MAAYLLAHRFADLRKVWIYTGVVGLCTLLAFNAASIPPYIDFVGTMVRKQSDFIRLVEYQNAGSAFYLTPLEPSIWGIMRVAPEAFLNCFIRPLPWNAGSFLYYPAILENLLIISSILIVIWQSFKGKVTTAINSRNLLWFCLTFTILLFVIIGLTTPVSGALVRYKVPALPFLGIAVLYLVNTKSLNQRFPFLGK